MFSLERRFRKKSKDSPAEGIKTEVNKAAATNTHRENARGPVVTVTAPNGSGRYRGRTLDCSALTPDGTHRAPSHRRAGSKRVRMEAWQEAFSLRSFFSASITT